jgi:transglutaminase-like putative cysteine protease
MRLLHDTIAYVPGSTEVTTTAADAWDAKTGVCQDFAHLMAGALRMLGLPARYVSGYLLTRAPGDAADMVGADASHAWAQVYCPGTPGVPDSGPAAGWLDLDPTNNLVPGTGHIRVAMGRDYGDVTPLRGVIRGGGGQHTLTVGVGTRVVGPVVARV